MHIDIDPYYQQQKQGWKVASKKLGFGEGRETAVELSKTAIFDGLH